MRIEIDKYGNRNEYSDEGKWLYQDQSENDRYFTGIVLLGKDEKPWAECTDADKQAWEDEHRPEPTADHEPEIQEAEIIDE